MGSHPWGMQIYIVFNAMWNSVCNFTKKKTISHAWDMQIYNLFIAMSNSNVQVYHGTKNKTNDATPLGHATL